MRIGPFIFTTVNRLRGRVTELALVMRAPDDMMAALVLYTRLVTGETKLASLVAINQEIEAELALQQEEKNNGSDPQSGEIASESESGV